MRRYGANRRLYVVVMNTGAIICLAHMFFVVAFVCGICIGANPLMNESKVSRLLLNLFPLRISLQLRGACGKGSVRNLSGITGFGLNPAKTNGRSVLWLKQIRARRSR